jgi:hypothetical protein
MTSEVVTRLVSNFKNLRDFILFVDGIVLLSFFLELSFTVLVLTCGLLDVSLQKLFSEFLFFLVLAICSLLFFSLSLVFCRKFGH